MKKNLKRLLCGFLALVITLSSLWYVNRVLMLKRSDGITPMQSFYAQEENTVDVLILGSSHAGMNLDAESFWSEYGISNYILWGSVQPFWNTYHYLIEALKTQDPKVVVLDVYAVAYGLEYSDDSRQVVNTAGMKLSWNKWEAIKASAPKERWANLLLGYPIFHQRYAELTEDDFMHFPWSEGIENEKGSIYRYGTGNVTMADVSQITEVIPIPSKQEEYLRKIIELCEDRSLPIVLVTTPTAPREGEQPYYNAVAQIAEEYGVKYLNFNLMDVETGFTADCYWTDDSHLNTKGARLISNYLAEYLLATYDIEDHRGDVRYESWDEHAVFVQNSYLTCITDMDDYFDELSRDGRMVFLIKNSSWETSENYERLLSCLSRIGGGYDEILQSGGGDWLITNSVDGQFINQYFGDMYSEFEFDGRTFTADFASGTGISIDGNTVHMPYAPGVICVVYDTRTHECVDIVEFLADTNFMMQHVLLG